MTRLLFRLSNAPAVLLIAMLGVAIQTSLFSFWILNYLQPDVLLLLVIWCALKRPFIEGGILVLMIGEIAEIHSAAPSGIFMVSYMLAYLALRGAARIVVLPNLSAWILATLFLSILTKGINMSTFWLLGGSTSQVEHMLLFVFPNALMNGMIGKWFYPMLEKLDNATFKNARAEQAVSDDLQLESGGI